MLDTIFEKLSDEKKNPLWMCMIFNKDKITAKIEQWTKEAEEADMTLTEYLESINPLNDKEKLSKVSRKEEKRMVEVKESFNTEYPKWIIAFCPDTNSFFVTNQRHFFWESEEKFNSENDGIDYFEHHVQYFMDIANEIIHTKKIWLDNTSKWYEV